MKEVKNKLSNMGKNGKIIICRLLSIFCFLPLILGIVTFASGSSFEGNGNEISPSVINAAGTSSMTSTSNELEYCTGETGISSFSSTNNFLYSGNLETVSYPLRVTSIAATPGPDGGEITLSWSAPGADGITGTCYSYDIRYSTNSDESPALSEDMFQQCRSVSELATIPAPQSYGTPHSLTISGLIQATSYYFAMKSRDANYSWSFLSNGTTAYCPAKILSVTIGPTTSYNFGSVEIGGSTSTATGFVIKNTGNTTEKFLIKCATITQNTTWGPGSNPALDIFTLKAVFNPAQPIETDFGPEDIIYSTNTASTNTSYTIDGSQKGHHVKSNEQKTIWYLLNMPTDTTIVGEQKMKIYITAEEQD